MDRGKQHVTRSPSTLDVLSLACVGALEPSLSPSTAGSPCLSGSSAFLSPVRKLSQLLHKFDLLAASIAALMAAGALCLGEAI